MKDQCGRVRQSRKVIRLAEQVREVKVSKVRGRKDLQQARKSKSLTQEQVSLVAKSFFHTVRSHNKLVREQRKVQEGSDQRSACHQCHSNL